MDLNKHLHKKMSKKLRHFFIVLEFKISQKCTFTLF